MLGFRIVAALIGGIGMASMAAAEPLSCEAFKNRLSGALVVASDPGSEMPGFKDQRSTDTGGSHANWDTGDLSGSITCGAADRFQEFYVSLDVTTRDRFAEQLKRLVSLDGAAICSVATAAPAACADTGKLLLQDALQQMGAGFKRKATNPSGTSARMIWPDLKAQLTAAPSLLTFSIGVPDGAVLDAERRVLPALPIQPAQGTPAP